MTTLNPDECRALGTLIEKAMTTPGQYPLSLNALVVGIGQKSNREPSVEIDEEAALRAVDGLCAKGLARNVHSAGSRVEKYRHVAGEALGLRAPELAVLAELLLRGPQTVGEIRGRASRMHPLESLEVAEEVLRTLAAATDSAESPVARPALVREIAPLPGTRAPRWVQLLCESLHPVAVDGSASAGRAGPCSGEGRGIEPSQAEARDSTRSRESGSPPDAVPTREAFTLLEARVRELERTLSEMKSALGM